LQQVLGFLRRLPTYKIGWTGDKLMAIGENLARDERRILELPMHSEGEVNPLSDLIHNPLGDEHLYTDVGI
jgi:hypothetical protein